MRELAINPAFAQASKQFDANRTSQSPLQFANNIPISSIFIALDTLVSIMGHFTTIFAPKLITLFFNLLRQNTVDSQNHLRIVLSYHLLIKNILNRGPDKKMWTTGARANSQPNSRS